MIRLLASLIFLWPSLATASETVMTISGAGEVLAFSKDDFDGINTAFDTRLNEHVIFFKFSEDATIKFSKFTYNQINKIIDISVCGKLVISPKIISAIYGGNGRLSNLASEAQAKKLAEILKTGKCN